MRLLLVPVLLGDVVKDADCLKLHVRRLDDAVLLVEDVSVCVVMVVEPRVAVIVSATVFDIVLLSVLLEWLSLREAVSDVVKLELPVALELLVPVLLPDDPSCEIVSLTL